MKSKSEIRIDSIRKEHARKDIVNTAKTFLSFQSMTHKKLQKLCYYAQVWHYIHKGEPLFTNSFEAWVHGPVSVDLYKVYKKNNGKLIPKEKSVPEIIEANPKVLNFLIYIFKVHGRFSGDELEKFAKSEDPWVEARGDLRPWQEGHNLISLKPSQ